MGHVGDTGDGFGEGEGFGPEDVGALDEEERGMYVEMVEGHYAEALYLEANPPSPAEYAREACEDLAGEPHGLDELESEIRERCEVAAFRVAVGDRSYGHHREIYGAEAHRVALARRRAALEAVRRWRRGETDSLVDLVEVTEEIRRAERPQDP